MNQEFRLALLAYLAQKVGGRGQLGRKATQKLIHLISRLARVETGYKFSYYTYGPYSSQISSDLELAEIRGILNSNYDPFSNSYSITSSDHSGRAVDLAGVAFSRSIPKIDSVIEKFGNRTAKSLELTSTLLFLIENEGSILTDRSDYVKRLKSLKPKYEESEIGIAYDELIREKDAASL